MNFSRLGPQPPSRPGMYASPPSHPPHGPFAPPQGFDPFMNSVNVIQTRVMRYNLKDNPEDSDCPMHGRKQQPGPPPAPPPPPKPMPMTIPVPPPPQFACGHMTAGPPPLPLPASYYGFPMPLPMAAYYYQAGPSYPGYHFGNYYPNNC